MKSYYHHRGHKLVALRRKNINWVMVFNPENRVEQGFDDSNSKIAMSAAISYIDLKLNLFSSETGMMEDIPEY